MKESLPSLTIESLQSLLVPLPKPAWSTCTMKRSTIEKIRRTHPDAVPPSGVESLFGIKVYVVRDQLAAAWMFGSTAQNIMIAYLRGRIAETDLQRIAHRNNCIQGVVHG
jgi:hypothetical protein